MRQHVLSCGFLVVGAAWLIMPASFAHRVSITQLSEAPPPVLAVAQTLRALGGTAVALGLGILWWARCSGSFLFRACILVASFVPLTLAFWDWHIDDAAITYAYAENLVRGYGLVLHPSHAPEEAYSNTLWLLVLALLRWLGIALPVASKWLSTCVGSLALVACLRAIEMTLQRRLSGLGFSLLVASLLSAPFVIWSISGLEHGLQALFLVTIVWCATRPQGALLATGAVAALLVLTRPETPLLVGALLVCLASERWHESKPAKDLFSLWPIAVLPAVAWLGLEAFRLAYFGDAMPNPFYVKASEATFLRLLNPLNAGWTYVWSWLASTGTMLLLVPIGTVRISDAPRSVRVALALLMGQLAFVVYAGGDWMSHFRFLAAPSLLVAFLAIYGLEHRLERGEPWVSRRYVTIAACGLCVCNLPLLMDFRAHPSTPYLVVAHVGKRFVDLAERLGIRHPVLAHHDAGGTSYAANIDLIDLAGLGTREIAKHRWDADFLRHYLLEERKPDFVYGVSTSFAAATMQLDRAPAFLRDYVPVSFEGDEAMRQSDLCHVRRERVHEAPGIEIERIDGRPVRVVVRRGSGAAVSEQTK